MDPWIVAVSVLLHGQLFQFGPQRTSARVLLPESKPRC